MNHYLFTARSITHAQRMARILEQNGVSAYIRRISRGIAGNGCGYTLQVPERKFRQAAEALRNGGVMPVKVFFVTGGKQQEVAL